MYEFGLFFAKPICLLEWQNFPTIQIPLQYNMAQCFSDTIGSFYQDRPTIIPAWICNNIPYKWWDGITYAFPNFNGCTVEVLEWISNFILHLVMDVITYPCWD